MGSYDDYKRGRDLAWETLIKCGISSLPVALDQVCDVCGIRVISYKKAGELNLADKKRLKGRMFADIVDGKKTVFVNTALKDSGSVRFSMAKGIGLCLLSDNPGHPSKGTEYEAGIFARDLLMPAVVLSALKIRSAWDIERICKVSHRAAEIRANRMAALYERNRFNSHPLEQKVGEMFKKFVEENSRSK